MVLFWQTHTCNITSGDPTPVLNSIATDPTYGLPALGCTGIKHDGESAGGWTGKYRITVLLLPCGGNFWFVLVCAGDGTDADAKSELNMAFENIQILIDNNFGTLS